jgi:uncharacterized membrane protein
MVSSISPAAAMTLCSSIASGMIALTGIVFSLTIVMVQFSAIAYSPRLVMWMAREPVVSHALGVFIATFLYALAMLSWVDRSATGHVPFISCWIVVGLLVASMGMFIALIDRVGMLQLSRMLIFTGDQGRKAIKNMYLSPEWTVGVAEPEEIRKMPVRQTIVHTGRPRAVQAIDVGRLQALAASSNALIEVVAVVGDTVIEMTPLLFVRGGNRPLDEARLKDAIEIGEERTFEQDPKYAIRLMVDIAIKALSPAINDPTTAVQALDQIEDLLFRLGSCCLETGAFRDAGGNLRLVIRLPTWEDFLRLALDEIRSYGADSVQVMRRMKALIANLLRTLPAERHAALREWEHHVDASIKRTFEDTAERQIASVADRQGLGLG